MSNAVGALYEGHNFLEPTRDAANTFPNDPDQPTPLASFAKIVALPIAPLPVLLLLLTGTTAIVILLWILKLQMGLTDNDVGTNTELTAVATKGTDDTKAVVAGYTYSYREGTDDMQTTYAAVSLTMSLPAATPAPTPTPTPLGTLYTTVPPDSTLEILTPSGTAAPAATRSGVAASIPPTVSVTLEPSPTMSPAPATGTPSLQMNAVITSFPTSAGKWATASPSGVQQTSAPTSVGGIIEPSSTRGLTLSPASTIRGADTNMDSDGRSGLSTSATIAVVIAAAVIVMAAVAIAESKRRGTSRSR